LKFTNVTIAEAAQRIQPQTQTALVADPKINYVLALYDSVEVPSVVAAIRAAHADDRVKVATFNGTPSIFKMIKDGDIVQMDVGEDINWIAHAVLDQDMRLAAGLKPVSDPKVGIRVIDDSNVGQTGNPPKDAKGDGSAVARRRAGARRAPQPLEDVRPHDRAEGSLAGGPPARDPRVARPERV